MSYDNFKNSFLKTHKVSGTGYDPLFEETIRAAYVVSLEKKVEELQNCLYIFEDSYDENMMQLKVIQLKQSDGEGWAVGEMLQRLIVWKRELESE